MYVYFSILSDNYLNVNCLYLNYLQIFSNQLFIFFQQPDLPDNLLTRSMFFNSFQDLARVIVVGVMAYISLIFFLRISGKRTLSKMNAFDFVVTVALGSTLATILLSKDVSFSEGAVALALLIGLQYVIACFAVRSDTFNSIIKSEPTLIYYGGNFLEKNLKQERVTRSEVVAAMREQGFQSFDRVQAVILETTGSLSVVKKENTQQQSTLQDIKQKAVD